MIIVPSESYKSLNLHGWHQPLRPGVERQSVVCDRPELQYDVRQNRPVFTPIGSHSTFHLRNFWRGFVSQKSELAATSRTESRSTGRRQPDRPGLGTFGGVFTPCTLTILGVIMFLRLGNVVGQSGMLLALAIIAASTLITTLTSLSLSAISTNTKVQGGGAYFLISRSLGVEFGGAIGIVFFFAQAISVAMYVIGFAEAFVATFGPGKLSMTMVATLINVIVFICVYVGAQWTIKVQYFILAILAASLLSFFAGAAMDFDLSLATANFAVHFTGGESFFTMFALFFPAVTGIMAGANLSGELANPGKSIPLGTLSAIGVTTAVYALMAVFLAGSRSHGELIDNNMIVSDIAMVPVLIVAGVFAATLSSALGSMMGAPRILQALAKDDVFPTLKYFSIRSGVHNEPRRAIIVTFIISQFFILTSDLDSIAPLITMAFMITYGLINLATFYEGITKNPSYRPRFRYSHWSIALLGAAGCIAVMLLIDWRWALVAIILMSGIHYYIGRREIQARWGDINSGLLFERTRKNLLKLESELYHPKNWRPIILALSGAGWDRPHLAIYGHWLTNGHGILLLGQIILGELEDRVERIEGQEEILHRFISEQELEAFPSVVAAPYLSDGIESLVQCQGFGALRPNTVLVGWPTSAERAAAFVATLRVVSQLKRSIVAARFVEHDTSDPWQPPAGTIDVWWRGQKNGELMVLLAHLLTLNPEWRTRQIRLLRVIDNPAGRDEVKQHLKELIDSARIQATPQVVVENDPHDAIQQVSESSGLTIFGFEPPEEGAEVGFWEAINGWAGRLPRVLFVSSAGNMSVHS